MTNDTLETITNVVQVATKTYTMPQQVGWEFKQWVGVIGMIFASVYTAFHTAFPKVQDFIDSRDGGVLQVTFFKIFGKPKQEIKT